MLLVTSHTHLWHGRKHPVTLRRENHNPPGHDQAKQEAVDWPPALPRAQEKGQGFGLQSEEGKNNAQGVQEKGKPLGQEGAVCREEDEAYQLQDYQEALQASLGEVATQGEGRKAPFKEGKGSTGT